MKLLEMKQVYKFPGREDASETYQSMNLANAKLLEIAKSKHYRQIKLTCGNFNYLHSNYIVNLTKSI